MNTTITPPQNHTRNPRATPIVDRRQDPTLVRRTFGVVTDPQSYRNLAYLLVGLPLGTLWFSLLVTGAAIGISTLVLALLGIPVLIGCWYMTRSIANVERVTANTLLGQQLAPAPFDAPPGNPWARLRAMTADTSRWRELGFVLMRFPVGIATFTAAIALLTTSATLVYAPFYARYVDDHSFGDWTMSSRLEGMTGSTWSWLLVVLGALSLVASLHLMNALARACGRWTTAWLGPVESSVSTVAAGQPALTSEGLGQSALLRVHAFTFAAVMSVLAVIDVAEGGSVWIHWPLITWGAVLALHGLLVRSLAGAADSRREQVLRAHTVVFAVVLALLVMIDVAGGGGTWFYWPLITWGPLVGVHAWVARRSRATLAQ